MIIWAMVQYKRAGDEALIKKVCLMGIMMILMLANMPIKVLAEEKPVYVASTEELYQEIYGVLEKKVMKKTFLADFPVTEVSIDEMMGRAFEEDPYIAFLFSYLSLDGKPVRNQYEISIRPRFYMGSLQEKLLRSRIEAIAKEVEGLSRYQQIKYVYDYIILNCEYDGARNGPYNALVAGHACCNGYASAFYMVMGELGIPCKYTYNLEHAWNTVYLDGYWYNLDATWGDGGGRNVDYEYFLKSNKDWTGLGPTEADAPQSYPVPDAFPKYDFPDFQQRDNIKMALIIGGLVLALFFIKVLFRSFSENSRSNRIARNEELIRNMYRLPDE
ncbi:MAG: hypothetical protein HDR01_09340 [Lachnospiraceae bacterium]|nr:hypothetical protein [Lachnospiraceae bacterium]